MCVCVCETACTQVRLNFGGPLVQNNSGPQT